MNILIKEIQYPRKLKFITKFQQVFYVGFPLIFIGKYMFNFLFIFFIYDKQSSLYNYIIFSKISSGNYKSTAKCQKCRVNVSVCFFFFLLISPTIECLSILSHFGKYNFQNTKMIFYFLLKIISYEKNIC